MDFTFVNHPSVEDIYNKLQEYDYKIHYLQVMCGFVKDENIENAAITIQRRYVMYNNLKWKRLSRKLEEYNKTKLVQSQLAALWRRVSRLSKDRK